jgi:hypothetical protein
MRLEVRCCCQPTKLLGWVQVEQRTIERAHYLIYPRLIRKPPPMSRVSMDQPVGEYVTSYIQLPLAFFEPGNGEHGYVALKAEGYDQEELKALLGDRFEPAP